MKIAVLGTGMVGEAIGSKLIEKGYQVMMGSRTQDNENAIKWANGSGNNASHGTFATASAFSDGFIFNCTKGEFSLDALIMAGQSNLSGKILIDVSNPLDFSKGMPPSLSICNTDSLAEHIQNKFPDLKVVKTLNTMNCQIMLDPGKISGEHDVFVSGNDSDAKQQVSQFLGSFGWKNIIDLGDITTARGTEMLLPIWLRLWGALGTADFNFHIAK